MNSENVTEDAPSGLAAQCSPCKCINWAWGSPSAPLTRHHYNCKHVDDSLIDVWKVSWEGSSYYVDKEPDSSDMVGDEVITKEKMHREIFERTPEFQGF